MRYFENPYTDGTNPSIDVKIENFVENVVRPMVFEQQVAVKSTNARNRRDSLYKGDLGRAFILLLSPWFKGKLLIGFIGQPAVVIGCRNAFRKIIQGRLKNNTFCLSAKFFI